MLGRCESEDYEGPSDRCPCEAEHVCLACDRAKCDGCMSGGMHPLCLECTDRFVEAGLAVVDAPDAKPTGHAFSVGDHVRTTARTGRGITEGERGEVVSIMESGVWCRFDGPHGPYERFVDPRGLAHEAAGRAAALRGAK